MEPYVAQRSDRKMRFSLFFVLALAVLLVSYSDSFPRSIQANPQPYTASGRWESDLVRWLTVISSCGRSSGECGQCIGCRLTSIRSTATWRTSTTTHHHSCILWLSIPCSIAERTLTRNWNKILYINYTNFALYHMQSTSIK